MTTWTDQPLDLPGLPAPAKPGSIEQTVRTRDGAACRMCGKTDGAPPIVSIRQKPDEGFSVDPEHYIAVVCNGCAQRIAQARVEYDRTHSIPALGWESRMVLRAMTWIYLENLMSSPQRVMEPIA